VLVREGILDQKTGEEQEFNPDFGCLRTGKRIGEYVLPG
jgi:hypothetical protein